MIGKKQKLILATTWIPFVVVVGLYYAVSIQTGSTFEFGLVSGLTQFCIASATVAISGGASLDKWVEKKTEKTPGEQ